MQRTKIKGTELEVSILGLGTVKLGRNTAVKYPKHFDIPDDKAALHILNTAADCGINLLDTAPAYGNSEERLGQLLPKTCGHWIIATKVGEIFDASAGESYFCFTPEHIQQSIESSLRRLRRDHLDIVLIHSNGQDRDIIEQEGALETLNYMKQKGLVGATGMSTKTIEGGILAVQQADIVMVTHNLSYNAEVAVIDYANEQGKNIFIKKALASGHNTSAASAHIKGEQIDNIRASFDDIYSQQGVNSIILGSITPEHIKTNATKAIDSFNQHRFQIETDD
ncbi:aldo/keto reductase [Eionea flava]